MLDTNQKGATRMVKLLRNKRRELDRELAQNARDREIILQEIEAVEQTICQLSATIIERDDGWSDDSGNNERSIH